MGMIGTFGRAQARCPRPQRLGIASRALRKEHEDLAAVQRGLTRRERITAPFAAATLHRNDADDVGDEPAAHFARGEIVDRRHRPQLRQEMQRHQRHERQRIEVGVVVGGEHRRPVFREALAIAHPATQLPSATVPETSASDRTWWPKPFRPAETQPANSHRRLSGPRACAASGTVIAQAATAVTLRRDGLLLGQIAARPLRGRNAGNASQIIQDRGDLLGRELSLRHVPMP